MHQFGFDFRDPRFSFGDWTLSLQLFTFENLYGIDAGKVSSMGKDTLEINAAGLTWAGAQENSPGTAGLSVSSTDDGIAITARGTHQQNLRRVKVTLHGLPDGTIIGQNFDETDIGDGQILVYPASAPNTKRIQTPLVFLKTKGGDYIYFQSVETEMRPKTFAIYRDPMGNGTTVELIHEELGPKIGRTIETPVWRVGRTSDPDAIVKRHIAHFCKVFGVTEWHANPNIPQWLKEVGFVAYIHGQHWSGHILNDYEAIRVLLHRLAEKLDGKRILAHLAGWEGRYYWKYGDYTPDARMGGPEGFKRLCDEAHGLGIHIQTMLGGNCANRALPGFWQWGETSYMRRADGGIEWGNSPDWDTSRAHETSWQAWLNPGAPGWGNHLFDQASSLIETYGVDSIFLDTDGHWVNDPQYPVYDGFRRLHDRLKARHPNVVLTGEHWSDGMLAISPFTHDELLHDMKNFVEHLAPYFRTYPYNSWGDPGRGSNGVFEGGWSKYRATADASYVVPGVVFVDGTMDAAPAQIDAAIAQAKRFIAALPK
ncbi:MAG: hypothetical protein ABL879_05365 [Devosia sp.]